MRKPRISLLINFPAGPWLRNAGEDKPAAARRVAVSLVTSHSLVSVSPDCRVRADVVVVNVSPQVLCSYRSLGTLQLFVLTEIRAAKCTRS